MRTYADEPIGERGMDQLGALYGTCTPGEIGTLLIIIAAGMITAGVIHLAAFIDGVLNSFRKKDEREELIGARTELVTSLNLLQSNLKKIESDIKDSLQPLKESLSENENVTKLVFEEKIKTLQAEKRASAAHIQDLRDIHKMMEGFENKILRKNGTTSHSITADDTVGGGEGPTIPAEQLLFNTSVPKEEETYNFENTSLDDLAAAIQYKLQNVIKDKELEAMCTELEQRARYYKHETDRPWLAVEDTVAEDALYGGRR